MNKSEAQEQYDILIEEHQALKLNKNDNPDLTLANHHIIPKGLGGDDESANLVMLTVQAHFEAHELLATIHECGPMSKAFFLMCNTMKNEGVEISAENYAKAKEENRIAMLGNQYAKGLMHNDKTKALLSKLHTGNQYNKGRKAKPGTKKKMREARKGKKPALGLIHTQETKDKIGAAHSGEKHHMFGKHLEQEVKDKISESSSGEKHRCYDHTEYTFNHKCGDTFTGTRYNFYKQYNLDPSSVGKMIRGVLKTTKGWVVQTMKTPN